MNESYFSLSSYQFEVPLDLIAQYPATPRDSARLLIVDRSSGTITEGIVADLPSLLSPHDAMILNNTRVMHAALHGMVEGRRGFQCLLTHAKTPCEWWAMAKPARALPVGAKLLFAQDVTAVVLEISSDGQRLLLFSKPLTPESLQTLGSVPLPPYIQREPSEEFDANRYQTIYGTHFGSVAAPTAGLHFTESLFANLFLREVATHYVTLHVGTGTFLPIRVPDIRHHQMHTESFEVSQQTAAALNALPHSSRRLAIGTTSCRVLESIADESGTLSPGKSTTNLFIYPGYRFKFVTALLTNFHTPESSLLTLVSAFMGYDLMKEAYQTAIDRRFRLFSYGDAMLIL